MKKKLLSIALSIMVAASFMPMAAEVSFAEDDIEGTGDEPVVEEPEEPVAPAPKFNPEEQVTGVKVKSFTYKSVKLTWKGVSEADGYKIYRAASKTGSYKLIKTQKSTTFNDTGNNSLSKYKYYKIRAYGTVNGKTKDGKCSNVFRARAALPAPSGVATEGKTKKIKITWKKVSGAKKYRVYRATSKTGKYSRLVTTTKCSYTSEATSGQRYYFKIMAVRDSFKSQTSKRIEGLAILSAPKEFKRVQKDDGIALSWSKVSQAYCYRIYRADTSTGTCRYLAEVKNTSYLDTNGLVNRKTYYYRVRAMAMVNGELQAGKYYADKWTREGVIALAKSYYGIRENSSKHRDIVNTFNSARKGAIGYWDPWCAAFVSAIEIKAGNSSLIPLGSYCPTMLSKFKKKTYSKTYRPKTADVIFFDWNWNRVPDHVGFVDNYNSTTDKITTIEGNCSDTVKCRTFKRGQYSFLLAYGLPAYSGPTGVNYKEPKKPEPQPEEQIEKADNAVSETEVQDAVSEAQGQDDYDRVVALADYVQEEEPAEDTSVDESTYDAFLMQEACEDMGIESCVITNIDANGNLSSYNEIVIDGQLYILDASEGSTPEAFVPEELY
ncbi:MAG: CHAP domain-containing protein [Clostridia bacterium]|nr:CHAP domain-containing protein [Clostridia bacterium]